MCTTDLNVEGLVIATTGFPESHKNPVEVSYCCCCNRVVLWEETPVVEVFSPQISISLFFFDSDISSPKCII